MTNEELLTPRFKVIADYPHSVFKVGEIVDFGKSHFFMTGMENFPHLFQKLNWWEGRTQEDMPKYLKFVWKNKIDEVRQVMQWLHEVGMGEDFRLEKDKRRPITGFTHESDFLKENGLGGNGVRVSINGWLPATEEEFNSFDKSKMYKR